MQRIATHPVAAAELRDPLAQLSLLSLQPPGLGLARGQVDQEASYQGGDGRIPLGRFHARTAIGFIIHRDCDIFHTHSSLTASGVKHIRM